ncbi:MAG: glycerate kinase, partial [Pseudomonadota bacterium]
MKIVAAPNALKGSLKGTDAARAIATGIRRAAPDAEMLLVPVADGGDGLFDVALDALKGEAHSETVHDPLQRPIDAQFCYVPGMRFAAVEMALASGLALLKEHERDPLKTTSLGTGELIKAALALDIERLGIGIGGSATNDGGMGVAQALGVRFLDADGNAVEPIGANLERLRHIDVSGLDDRIADKRIEAVCDVDNVLCGPEGAAAVYGPQKGATPEMIERLDAGLANYAEIIARDLGQDVRDLPGAGAAGGLGAGLKAILGA